MPRCGDNHSISVMQLQAIPKKFCFNNMSWEAQKHLYQVAFSCLDKFFQYKISGDFEREKKKTFKGFAPLLSFIQ